MWCMLHAFFEIVLGFSVVMFTCCNINHTYSFVWISLCTLADRGTQWRSWLRHCATSRKVAGLIPDGVIGIFHCHNPSGRTIYGPGVDSASNRNEYQECFLGVKAAGAWGWQPYHLHVPTVLKSGSLNLLEPSGPGHACNGIAFTLADHTFFLFKMSLVEILADWPYLYMVYPIVLLALLFY